MTLLQELILVGIVIFLFVNPLLTLVLITVGLYFLYPTPTLTIAAIIAAIFIYFKYRR